MRKDKKRVLKRVAQIVISSFIAIGFISLFVFATQGRNIPVLDTHGIIADQQRDLILLTFGLGMLVVIPVFVLLFGIAWKYRAGNKNAKYEPELEGNKGLEALWWGVPCIIIIVLAIITGISTHALDPYKKLESNVEPVKVQVVAMQWKWLFIYPDKGVATLNYMNIPENTPVDLTITSDAPMNSFWVPALAGQVYAMSGMSTQLHLMANKAGTFDGMSANISGEGFADMRFKVNAMSETDYSKWIIKSAYSNDQLSSDSYAKLAEPSRGDGEKTFMLMKKDLYNEVIMKYMAPMKSEDNSNGEHKSKNSHSMPGMDM
jgi:cytochrome o ubiquinol oxidase subunit 2